MEKIISLLSFVCLVLSIQSVNAESLLPEDFSAPLPSYCFGVDVENSKNEIELNLMSERVYSLGHGVVLHVNNIIPRVGSTSVNGVVSGLAFAGGGSQSWEMNLSNTSSGVSGTLSTHTKTFYGDHSTEYDIVCD